jgi:hypothetical protein
MIYDTDPFMEVTRKIKAGGEQEFVNRAAEFAQHHTLKAKVTRGHFKPDDFTTLPGVGRSSPGPTISTSPTTIW